MSLKKKSKLEKEPNSKVEELSESVKEFEEARRKADAEKSIFYTCPGGATFERKRLGCLFESTDNNTRVLPRVYDEEYNRLKIISYLLRSGLPITYAELNKLDDYQLIMLFDIEQQREAS